MSDDKEIKDNEASAEDRIAKLEKERDEYLSGWQRAKADFINYKKDEVKRLEELAKYGTEDFVKELITVLDTFDLALGALEKQGPVEKGVYMIKAQLEDLLKRKGVSRINVSPGDPFDPSFAEALTEAESDYPEGSMIEVIEPGYRLHDKVIRAVRVKISKGKNQ